MTLQADRAGAEPGSMPEPPNRWPLLLLLPVALLTLSGVHLIRHTLGVLVTNSTQRRSLRLMTWNIGQLYLRWDSRAADRDLEHVASIVRAADPHVVALQELRGPEQLGRLLLLLGPEWSGRVPIDIYDRQAALISRLPGRYQELPTTTGRVAQGALLQGPDRFSFSVVSLHLDAFDAERRRIQAEELLAGARRLGSEHVFMCGDFNVDPAMAQKGSDDQQLYHFLEGELMDAAKLAGPTTVISRRLDYVFFRSTRIKRVTSQVLQKKRRGLMDHDPLLVELVL